MWIYTLGNTYPHVKSLIDFIHTVPFDSIIHYQFFFRFFFGCLWKFWLNNTSHSQALISIDPVRARDDPVVVKDIPYYKAKKALEAELLKLDPPPRPENWGVRACVRASVCVWSTPRSSFVVLRVL